MNGSLLFAILLLGTVWITPSLAQTVAWINEIHYNDNSGNVQGFVELAWSGGPITGFKINYYDGATGQIFGTFNFGSSFSTAPTGTSFGSFSPFAGLNGFALVDPNDILIEFLSYEGSVTAIEGLAKGLTSFDIGVRETGSTPVGFSLQRCPNIANKWIGPVPSTRNQPNAICVTDSPSKSPSHVPSVSPTEKPSSGPTEKPSSSPTEKPSTSPTEKPSSGPTEKPSTSPTEKPSSGPTEKPSSNPTEKPSSNPTEKPSSSPTEKPSRSPTQKPSSNPTEKPSSRPTQKPSSNPTEEPSSSPTENPSSNPTEKPSSSPTEKPSISPTEKPSLLPTNIPTGIPSKFPTENPTTTPSVSPSQSPTEDCSITWNLYNSETNTLVTELTNNAIVTNPPPCGRNNIEAFFPCAPQRVVLELWRGSRRVRRRRDYCAPYFLFANFGRAIFGGRIAAGRYGIRAIVDGKVSPFTNFTMGGSCW